MTSVNNHSFFIAEYYFIIRVHSCVGGYLGFSAAFALIVYIFPEFSHLMVAVKSLSKCYLLHFLSICTVGGNIVLTPVLQLAGGGVFTNCVGNSQRISFWFHYCLFSISFIYTLIIIASFHLLPSCSILSFFLLCISGQLLSLFGELCFLLVWVFGFSSNHCFPPHQLWFLFSFSWDPMLSIFSLTLGLLKSMLFIPAFGHRGRRIKSPNSSAIT